jgi:hypothetical protein
MSDAQSHFLSVVEQLTTDFLVSQVATTTEILMLDTAPNVVPDMFNYHRAILEVLLAECEQRGL